MRAILFLLIFIVGSGAGHAATQHYSVTAEGSCDSRLEDGRSQDRDRSGRCAVNYRFALDEADFGKRVHVWGEDIDRSQPNWKQPFLLSAYLEGIAQRNYVTVARYEAEYCYFYECAIVETSESGILTYLSVTNFEMSCLTTFWIYYSLEHGFGAGTGLCFDGIGSPDRALGGDEIVRVGDEYFNHFSIEMFDRQINYTPPFPTPLPGSAFLLIAGIGGLAGAVRRR